MADEMFDGQVGHFKKAYILYFLTFDLFSGCLSLELFAEVDLVESGS
jgi:hypothetical protein